MSDRDYGFLRKATYVLETSGRTGHRLFNFSLSLGDDLAALEAVGEGEAAASKPVAALGFISEDKKFHEVSVAEGMDPLFVVCCTFMHTSIQDELYHSIKPSMI